MALYRTLPDPTFQTHKSRVGSGYEIRYWVLVTARMLGLGSREFRPGCWIGCLFRTIFVDNRMVFCQGCGTQVVEHGKYCHSRGVESV